MRTLSKDEMAACRALGVTPEDFLNQLNEDSDLAENQEGDSISIGEIAQMMGLNHETNEPEK